MSWIACLFLCAASFGEPRVLVEEGRLVLATEEGTRELPCTDPGGTGFVHGFDRHPGGTIFVAAENGLFAFAPGVETLDRLERMDGAPAGPVLGVVVEGEERLWIVTPGALGCLDSRFFFGRTVTSTDGLPAPPYSGLRRGRGGTLWLLSAAGPFPLHTGRGERPGLRVREVDGRVYREGERYGIDPTGSLDLALAGEGTGPLTYRYRLEHHHLLLPLAGSAPRVEGLEPGDHRFFVTAWDRELRRSDEVPVDVRVAYPRAFDKRTLVPVAVGGSLLILLAFCARARRAGGGRLAYGKAAVSAFLAVALSLQLLVGVIPHGRSWPFVGFTMYLERYVEGSVTYKMTLQLLRGDEGDGIEPYDAGYGLYEFRRTLAEVIHGDGDERMVFLERLRARYGSDVEGYAILDERRRLTRSGPVTVSPTVMCVYREGRTHGSR